MSRRMQYLLGVFLIAALLISVNGQDKSKDDKPSPSKEKEKPPKTTAPSSSSMKKPQLTKGVIGAAEDYFWPVTSIFMQLIDSFLMHFAKKKLPCTVISLVPIKYKCQNLQTKEDDKKKKKSK